MILAGLAAGGFAIASGLGDEAEKPPTQEEGRVPDGAVRGHGAPDSEAESLEPEEPEEGVSGEVKTEGDNWKKRGGPGPGLTPEDVTRVKQLIDDARAER